METEIKTVETEMNDIIPVETDYPAAAEQLDSKSKEGSLGLGVAVGVIGTVLFTKVLVPLGKKGVKWIKTQAGKLGKDKGEIVVPKGEDKEDKK